MVNDDGISSLGLILVDTLDPVCQHPLDTSDMWVYEAMDVFQKSKALEDTITKDEKGRAQALEAILIKESMIKASERKYELKSEIIALSL